MLSSQPPPWASGARLAGRLGGEGERGSEVSQPQVRKPGPSPRPPGAALPSFSCDRVLPSDTCPELGAGSALGSQCGPPRRGACPQNAEAAGRAGSSVLHGRTREVKGATGAFRRRPVQTQVGKSRWWQRQPNDKGKGESVSGQAAGSVEKPTERSAYPGRCVGKRIAKERT